MRSLALVLLCLFGAASCRPESAPPPPATKRDTVPQTQPAAPEVRDPERVDDADDAAAVVRDYYDAIAARDFRRAFAYWGPSGPPRQTFESFVAGFAETANVTVQAGTPSRVEAAAGSRYVEVPVTIVATSTRGETTRYEGTYTVRRSVVDGATEAQRKWHLYRATLRRAE